MEYTNSFFKVASPGDGGDSNMVSIKEERVETAYDGVVGESVRQPQPSDLPGSSPSHRQNAPNSSSPAKRGSTSHLGLDGNQTDDEMAPTTRSSSRPANPPLPSEASPSKPAAAPKGRKKGTANPVKAPKRGGGKSGPASKKSKAAAAAKKKSEKPATADGGSVTGGLEDEEEEEDEADGGDEEDESDSGPYCICRGPDNHRFMIACERCEDWFHGDCIGMDKYTGENLVQQYICPNCTDGKLYVTRYKKTCAYGGCRRPARMYGDVIERAEEGSKFCSDEHCQAWWEQLIATLPKKKQGGADALTQGEFMGLLGNPPNAKAEVGNGNGWKLGDEPFGISPNFWETTPANEVFNSEESALLSHSAAERHKLGEEIVLSRKMLAMIDYAIKNRESLIQSASYPTITKDFCGYDYRLDTVGAPASFAAFIAPGQPGEAILKAGKLELPSDKTVEAMTTVMCTKKKCKPHTGWIGILTKMVKHQIKELAAQAKEMLDYEARIKDCAAVRYRRKQREDHSVEVLDQDVEMTDA